MSSSGRAAAQAAGGARDDGMGVQGRGMRGGFAHVLTSKSRSPDPSSRSRSHQNRDHCRLIEDRGSFSDEPAAFSDDQRKKRSLELGLTDWRKLMSPQMARLVNFDGQFMVGGATHKEHCCSRIVRQVRVCAVSRPFLGRFSARVDHAQSGIAELPWVVVL